MSKRRFLLLLLLLVAASPLLHRYAMQKLQQWEIEEALASRDFIEGSFESPLLSRFHQRPVQIRYALLFPHGRRDHLPLVIHIPGYGGNHRIGALEFDDLQEIMTSEPALAMAHLYIDPTNEFGHSFLVNSRVNGPWTDAILFELLPEIETRYRVGSWGRFITGHSSGGWSALWLFLSAPERFRGVWATAPDPVDFRNFFGADFTPGSKENFYKTANGKERPAARGRRQTQKKYVKSVIAEDAQENEWKAYEAAFGDGSPAFNRETGELSERVLELWEPFDLGKKLAQIGNLSLIDGKIFIRCGSEDTYFLEQPTALFCERLKALPIQSTCELIPGRNHVNLFDPYPTYPEGLLRRMLQEMVAQGAGE